jgi:DNA adenine methylase
MIRSLKRPGGKARLLPVLLPLFNEVHHTCYCEPFAGSFTAGMNKPRSTCEVLNDADQALVNAFRQIKHHRAALEAELGMVNSRADLMRLRKADLAHLTEIQRAAIYLWSVLISFGADGQSFGVQKTGGGGAGSRLSLFTQKLKDLQARLDGVIIESVDWQRCLKLYDSPATLFFLDPPYTTGPVKTYAPFTEEHMDALKAALLALKGQWCLTVDDTPANRARFGPWLRATKSSASGMGNHAKGTTQFHEIVCTSWPAPALARAA